MQGQDEAFRGPRVVRFLKHLLRQIPGKLLVILDGSLIHRSKVVKAFLADGGAERLGLERLPRQNSIQWKASGVTGSGSACGRSAVAV